MSISRSSSRNHGDFKFMTISTGSVFAVILIFICMLSKTSSIKKAGQEVQLNLTISGLVRRTDAKSHNKVLVCYLGTWAIYRPEGGSYDMNNDFDPEMCTHLIYSFGGLDNVTNEFKPLDTFLDLEEENGRAWYKKANLLKRRYSHLKVLLAVGGWNEGSIKYSKMAENQKNRRIFIKSALDMINKYGFDGLDLDWEFPGSRDGRPEDKRHFTMLVRELRTAFDPYGLLISAAFGASPKIAEGGYELPELSRLLDNIHLMCYDYHGSWDKKTYHNAPLFSSITNNSVQFSVDYFLKQGVSPQKLVLGLPLYGRTFLLTDGEVEGDGLLQPAGEKGFQGPFTREDGFVGYNEICQKLVSNRGDWRTYWDPEARVPYMRNGAKWVGFDNPDSLMEKVAFAHSRGLKGVMVWSVDTDDFKGTCGGSLNPLLRSINYAFAQKSSVDKQKTKKLTETTKKSTGSHSYPYSSISVLTTAVLLFATAKNLSCL